MIEALVTGSYMESQDTMMLVSRDQCRPCPVLSQLKHFGDRALNRGFSRILYDNIVRLWGDDEFVKPIQQDGTLHIAIAIWKAA